MKKNNQKQQITQQNKAELLLYNLIFFLERITIENVI